MQHLSLKLAIILSFHEKNVDCEVNGASKQKKTPCTPCKIKDVVIKIKNHEILKIYWRDIVEISHVTDRKLDELKYSHATCQKDTKLRPKGNGVVTKKGDQVWGKSRVREG